MLDFQKTIDATQGKIFSLRFKKKDGSFRTMSCRLNVQKYLKGGSLNYDPQAHKILVVFDMNKKEYRSVSLDSIISLKVDNQEYCYGD
jgi:hypothetical protein